MKMKLAALSAALAATAIATPVDLSKLPPPSTQAGITYDKEIRPLFEASCTRCHGSQRPKAGLRLDSLEGVIKGSKDGKVVTPGSSEKSQLVISVSQLDPDSAMPPKPRARRPRGADIEGGNTHTNAPEANHPSNEGAPGRPKGPPAKPLTAEQVGLVRAWIDQGAK